MVRSPIRRRPTPPSSVVLLALGAVTGVALGVLVAARVGGLPGLLGRPRRPQVPRNPARRDEEGLSEERLSEERLSEARRNGAFPNRERPRRPVVPSHEELEARVLEVFCHDPVLVTSTIDIGAVGLGTIELTGWVDSTGEIAHALTLARGVPGVHAVVDQLAIRGPGASNSHRLTQYGPPPRS